MESPSNIAASGSHAATTEPEKKKSTYCKQYYERNREKRIQQSKEYQRRNREKVQAYREQNREKELARMKVYNKLWYKQNRDKVLARLKEYRKKNPEKEAKWVKDYRERNKDKINQRKRERYSRLKGEEIKDSSDPMQLDFLLNYGGEASDEPDMSDNEVKMPTMRSPEPAKASLAFVLNA